MDQTDTSPEPVQSQGDSQPETPAEGQKKPAALARLPKEIGGPAGPEPTRYGDWQFKGRVTDF